MTTAVDTTHRLYRFYSDGGVLLYIGITDDLATRWNNHRRNKSWWDDVRSMTVEVYPSREALEAAEIEAIKAERPKYNVIHNRPTSSASPTRKSTQPSRSKPATAADYLRFAKVASRREQLPHFEPWDYPDTPPFGPWLLDQMGRSDEIGCLAQELEWLFAVESCAAVVDVRRLLTGKYEKWVLKALDEAEHEYIDRQTELGVIPTWTTLELLADHDEIFPRKIHIEQGVAAHVQLDRDNWYETIHGPRSISKAFVEAAEECAKAGCGRIWSDRLWLSRGLIVSASDHWVNLYVPLRLINAAVTALYDADVNGDLRTLRALTEELS